MRKVIEGMPTCDKSAVRFFGVHDLLVVQEDSGDECELAEEPGSGSQQYFFILFVVV